MSESPRATASPPPWRPAPPARHLLTRPPSTPKPLHSPQALLIWPLLRSCLNGCFSVPLPSRANLVIHRAPRRPPSRRWSMADPPPPFSRFTSQAPPPPSTLALGRREGKGPMDEGGSNNPPPSIGAGGFMAHTQRAAPSPPQPGAAQPS
jgi:hypothetical protein